MLTWSSVGYRNQNPARAALALNLPPTIKKMGKEDGAPFSLRTGIHFGPVVAGVIGKSKFACDLWGDTKNVASQIESSKTTNSIQVSDAIYRTLKENYGSEKGERWTSRGLARCNLLFVGAGPTSSSEPPAATIVVGRCSASVRGPSLALHLTSSCQLTVRLQWPRMTVMFPGHVHAGAHANGQRKDVDLAIERGEGRVGANNQFPLRVSLDASQTRMVAWIPMQE